MKKPLRILSQISKTFDTLLSKFLAGIDRSLRCYFCDAISTYSQSLQMFDARKTFILLSHLEESVDVSYCWYEVWNEWLELCVQFHCLRSVATDVLEEFLHLSTHLEMVKLNWVVGPVQVGNKREWGGVEKKNGGEIGGGETGV